MTSLRKIFAFYSRMMEYSIDSWSDEQISMLLHEALDLQMIPIHLVRPLMTPQSINRPDASGTRPIYKAIQMRDRKLVHAFLALKVDVNCINSVDWETPLHQCIRYNVPLSLLEHFVQPETVNFPNKDGDSPLHIAARSQQWELVESLIKAGSDINHANKKGIIPLHEVLTYEDIKYSIVKLLLSKQNVNAVDPDQYAPLHRLLQARNWELVSYVLTLGADVNMRTMQDENECTCEWSTLYMAIKYDAPNDLIGKFMSLANIKMTYDGGNLCPDMYCTPLHLAVIMSKWDIADMLISKGADVDLVDCDEETPLIHAIQNGTCPEKLFEKLISKANINMKGFWVSESALLVATQMPKSWHYIPILVERGADINENVDEEYETPLLQLLCCVKTPEMSIVKLLLSSENVNSRQEFFEPAYCAYCALKQVFIKGWWQFIPLLVQYGANVEGVLKSEKKEKPKVASLLDISTHAVRGLMIEKSDEYFDCLGVPPELLPQLKLRHLAYEVVQVGKKLRTRARRVKFAEKITW